MTAELYICMTSGIEGPKINLTEEQAQKAAQLALKLEVPWNGSEFAGRGHSPDHFMVSLGEEAEVTSIRTTMGGFVSIWKKGDTDWHQYRDTVGLWSYLAPMGNSAYIKWLDDAAKAMSDWEASLFPYNSPPWEPNF